MTQMTEEKARERVREVILELAPGANEVTVENPSLAAELGYHSLALLELAFALEDEFDLPPIDEASVQDIVTARDIEDHVIRQLKEKNAVPS